MVIFLYEQHLLSRIMVLEQFKDTRKGPNQPLPFILILTAKK
jgi:hypothetical protein